MTDDLLLFFYFFYSEFHNLLAILGSDIPIVKYLQVDVFCC